MTSHQPNPSPTSGSPLSVAVGAAVSFSATFSDADGDPMVAKWIFPDDFTFQGAVSGSSVPHTFNRAGRYPVTLAVRDSHGGCGPPSTGRFAPPANAARAAPDP